MAQKIFHAVDYVVTAAVLIISLLLGIFYALPRKEQMTTGDYIVGGRQMSVFPVATSMAVTYLSAVTILGFPAEIYYHGILFAFYCVGKAFGLLLAALLYVPVLYPLKLSSANQYIEMRYKEVILVRYASVMQIVCKTLMSGVFLYGPAILVQMVTGIPSWTSLLVCGLVGATYTTVGGYKAVIATDVFQAFIMFAGLIAVLVKGLVTTGGWSKVWEYYRESGRTVINVTPDPFAHNNIWAMVLFTGILHSWITGIIQAGVQRYSSMPTVEKARWMLVTAIIPMVLMTTLSSLAGIVAYGYYAHLGCDPLAAGYINTFNMIIPQLVADIMTYPGLPGLFISACICGALSNFSSSINAIAGMFWEDFLSKELTQISEVTKVRITKLIAVCFGILSLGGGFIALNMRGTIIKICLGVAAAGNVPVGLVFTIGILIPRANWKNALLASLTSFTIICTLIIGGMVTPFQHPTMPLPIHGCDPMTFPNHTNGNFNTTPVMNFNVSKESVLSMPNMLGHPWLNGTFVTVGDHTNRNFLQKILTISTFWYPFIGLAVGTFVSAMLSLIPGFYKTGVDKDLVFTFSKLFIRTNSTVEPEKTQMMKPLPHAASNTAAVPEPRDSPDDEYRNDKQS